MTSHKNSEKNDKTNTAETNSLFRHKLPPSRLGQCHSSFQSFENEVASPQKQKEFTLVVVTAVPCRILLGKKHRGFGRGMYNSFGGKFDSPQETPAQCACRELYEESRLEISVPQMEASKIGIQYYTFDNDPIQMVMHVFHIHMATEEEFQRQSPKIQGCDEITPEWFDDWHDIPLDNMFADDSHWLTALLSSMTPSSTTSPISTSPLQIHGHYHFQENCQETNTILQYYMKVQPRSKPPSFSLEKRLFHALHSNKTTTPSIKEFKESWAFFHTVKKTLFSSKKTRQPLDIVLDVAGGHGALAALFLITTTATRAVVIDPAADLHAQNQNGVEKAWKESFYPQKQLLWRSECLRTGLPVALQEALTMTTSPERILVVACHACQHLSEETLEIACQQGVHVAVMPCCQKDLSPGSSWKTTCQALQIPLATTMDLLLSGKVMGKYAQPQQHTQQQQPYYYDVRMKCIDPSITPQNRIILCRAIHGIHQEEETQNQKLDRAHAKLELAYRRAHSNATATTTVATAHQDDDKNNTSNRRQDQQSYIHDKAPSSHPTFYNSPPIPASSPSSYLAIGFIVGAVFSAATISCFSRR